ncbi:MAG: DNA-packaging protein [Bradyrhizobium sp.]|nr:DNA-packaging protein [Bradyrhizobium sp.]
MALGTASLAELLSSLPEADRAAIQAEYTSAELSRLEYDWPFWARPSQLAPPGRWRTWMLMAGRGAGKTRAGAEWIRAQSATRGRMALVAPTAGDVRDVIVEGESGILATSPPWNRPLYEPSKRRLTWPNGAQATCYSAEEPERLRGPQYEAGWCDEIASWRYPEAWDMLQFGMRLGKNPQVVVTTTPKPIKLVRDLLADSATVVTRGSTYDNRANLAPAFLEQMVRKYEGTRLGRQELNAELLDDMPGALWTRDMIDRATVRAMPEMRRIVVAVDPATTSGEKSNETGIIVAGLGADGLGYVIADLSCKESPDGWARRAVSAYRFYKADRIVAEANQGGDMVRSTIHTVDASASYKAVHASRGKYTRAEPVAALYEQDRVKHVGMFAALEDQMASFVTDLDRRAAGSPDRVDALVWALTELMVSAVPFRTVSPIVSTAARVWPT